MGILDKIFRGGGSDSKKSTGSGGGGGGGAARSRSVPPGGVPPGGGGGGGASSAGGGGRHASITAAGGSGGPGPARKVFETSASGKSYDQLFRTGKDLGEGAFSKVKEGIHKQSGRTYAVKIVIKAKLTQEDEVALKEEISVLRELKHNHIMRLYDVFDERQYFYLITELLHGGELFDRIVAKSYYNEREARDTCRILFQAMAYCHSHRVAHRDLKPENLLLLSKTDDSAIKIADFGFAKRVKNDRCLSTQCGTPGYVAPEILEGIKYGTKADMWSLGVITYILLGGYPPFIEQNQRELFRKIRRGQYEFHAEYWGEVSDDAKGLISSLLTVNPDRRISAEEALRNPWINSGDDALEGKDLGKNLEEFRRFNAKRKFKATVKVVMAMNKFTSLGDDFRNNLG